MHAMCTWRSDFTLSFFKLVFTYRNSTHWHPWWYSTWVIKHFLLKRALESSEPIALLLVVELLVPPCLHCRILAFLRLNNSVNTVMLKLMCSYPVSCRRCFPLVIHCLWFLYVSLSIFHNDRWALGGRKVVCLFLLELSLLRSVDLCILASCVFLCVCWSQYIILPIQWKY